MTKMILFFVGTLSPFCKTPKTELHDFAASEFSWKAVQWEVTIERSDIFSWKVLISMESKLDRVFGPKAIE